MSKGPTFIGIGQMKAGTSWLFDQFYNYPDLWMPRVKELHLFNSGFSFNTLENSFKTMLLQNSKTHKIRPQDPRSQAHWSKYENIDNIRRDYEFFAKIFLSPEGRKVRMRLRKFLQENKTVRVDEILWYKSLFPDDMTVTGEITPGYCTLKPSLIATIVQSLPHTKFILFLRHPADRTRSHLSHMTNNGQAHPDILHNVDAARNVLSENPHIKSISDAASIAERWLQAAPNRLCIIPFSRIRDKPKQVRLQVCEFLGLDSDDKYFPNPPNFNAKASRRKDVTDNVQTFLHEELAPEIKSFEALKLKLDDQYKW